MTIWIAHGISIFLCIQEGWKTLTMSRLSISQWLDNKEFIATTANFGHHGQIERAKYLTKMDVCWGYNNIRIWKGDKWKATFKTNKGLFEPRVMFFGMCNFPAMFQSMMDKIFVTMIKEKLVIIYMDDILIFAKTKEELKQIMKLVFKKFRENNLFLKARKCEFEKTKIEYLGMIIEEGQISMDPIKLAGIWEWPAPTTVKQVWSFLGFGNFYQKFISHYSNLAKPLTDLTKKDRKFEWTEGCQQAFNNLKKWFTEELVLLMPDHSWPFQIELDAFNVFTGAVLTQLDSNGDRHLVAFLLQTFMDTERWYGIYDRELLGIIWALKEWQHYLQGSGYMTTVFSDHKNLTYFGTAQKLNNWQARWSLYLQWETKPFKWFLKLNYFLNSSKTTEPNKFKFDIVVKYYVINKLQFVLLHNLNFFLCY